MFLNKRFWSRLFIGLILVLVVFGCQDPNKLGEADTVEALEAQDSARTSLSNNSFLGDYGYRYGRSLAFIDPAISNNPALVNQAIESNRAFLLAEYEEWKRNYITSEGAGKDAAGNKFLRVQRDFCLGSGLAYDAMGYANNWDTVSEGIAYGMLLSVYFNDQYVFDRLWKYAQLHHVSSTIPLMHWKVHRDGTNISEFGLPVPHAYTYLQRPQWEGVFSGTRNPDDVAYRTNNSSVPGGALYTGDNPYYLMAGGKRYRTSAADADYDIAAALCIAASKWSTPTLSGINYVNDACQQVKAVVNKSISNTDFVRAGNLWGDETCWNPSYFMPNWFRMYVSFIRKYPSAYGSTANTDIAKLERTITKVYQHMKIISNSTTAGLFPDWCDTSSGQVKRGLMTDRITYFDENGDGVFDNRDGKNALSKDDGDFLMSHNFYYDAIRTPWRLAMDYSWYGTADAYAMNRKIRSFYLPKGQSHKDGYYYNGDTWKREYRDGSNNILISQNGGQNYSTTFVAMVATAFMCSNDTREDAKLYEYYNAMKAKEDPTGVYTKYHYFGNTLRMLSLLYMSGYMTNPY